MRKISFIVILVVVFLSMMAGCSSIETKTLDNVVDLSVEADSSSTISTNIPTRMPDEQMAYAIMRFDLINFKEMILGLYDIDDGSISKVTVSFYDALGNKHVVESSKFTKKSEINNAFSEIRSQIVSVNSEFIYYTAIAIAWKASDGSNLALGFSVTDDDRDMWAATYARNGVAYDPKIEYTNENVSMRAFEEEYERICSAAVE